MSAFLKRLRQFQTPRVIMLVLLLGLAGQALARNRMGRTARTTERRLASLDSLITAAMPRTGDTSEASVTRMAALVSEKRDLEVNLRSAAMPWFVVTLLCSSLVGAALVTGGMALLSHLRGDR
jgi:hypothetical protein